MGIEQLAVHRIMGLLPHSVGGVRATTEQVLLAKAIAAETIAILANEINDGLRRPTIDRPPQPTARDKSGSTISQSDRQARGPQI
jgi:hypothetical protein